MTAAEELKKIIAEMEADRATANEKMNNKEYGQNLVSYFGGRNDVLDKYIYKLEQIATPQPPPMTNKTAMQQAIEKIDAEIKRKSLAAQKDEGTQLYINGLENAKSFLSLVTEKQDLSEAWTAGREYGCKHDDPETGEEYYDRTFGNSQNTQQ